MRSVRVELAERSYLIHVGPAARAMLQNCNIAAGARGAPGGVVIADRTIADLHAAAVLGCLPTGTPLLTFPAGEASKTLQTAGRLYDHLAAQRLDRGGVLVALGGGVAGDLAGFVAATWLRGVRYVQIPTTLLAAIDASVGGKTAVNIPAGKNLVGAFHQPIAVVIDTDFLATLPPREFAAGLAESVKHATIRDPALFAWHEAHASRLTPPTSSESRDAGGAGVSTPAAADIDLLIELIVRNCQIKADVVAQDEREAGLRAILNYGHTIGHALEHLLEYELRHGECVALGMLVENEIARRRGLLAAAVAERVRELLSRLGLPQRLPRPVAASAVLDACRVDKKARGGAVHFVLLAGLGEPRCAADVGDDEVVAALEVVQPEGG